MKLPNVFWFVNKQDPVIPKDLIHHCIDKEPLLQLALLLTIQELELDLDKLPLVYGYSNSDGIYFLNEEQHSAMNSKDICGV